MPLEEGGGELRGLFDGVVKLEEIDLIPQKRPVEDRNNRLGRVNGQRSEARSFAACEENRLHGQPPMLSWRSRLMNLPNSLSLARIFLVPLLVVVLLTKFEGRAILGVHKELVGAAIFALASLTDWLDGYLARRRQQVTALGQFIDPLADKLLTIAAFISSHSTMSPPDVPRSAPNSSRG